MQLLTRLKRFISGEEKAHLEVIFGNNEISISFRNLVLSTHPRNEIEDGNERAIKEFRSSLASSIFRIVPDAILVRRRPGENPVPLVGIVKNSIPSASIPVIEKQLSKNKSHLLLYSASAVLSFGASYYLHFVIQRSSAAELKVLTIRRNILETEGLPSTHPQGLTDSAIATVLALTSGSGGEINFSLEESESGEIFFEGEVPVNMSPDDLISRIRKYLGDETPSEVITQKVLKKNGKINLAFSMKLGSE